MIQLVLFSQTAGHTEETEAGRRNDFLRFPAGIPCPVSCCDSHIEPRIRLLCPTGKVRLTYITMHARTYFIVVVVVPHYEVKKKRTCIFWLAFFRVMASYLHSCPTLSASLYLLQEGASVRTQPGVDKRHT